MKYLKIKYTAPLLLASGCICFIVISCLKKPDEKNPACVGKDRWDVKTLTDIGELNINYTPVITSVKELINIPLTNTINDNTPRFGIEFNTYSIKCRIREYKLSDDGDYHLVLEDIQNSSITMVGEIPDEYCASVQQSKHLSSFVKARTDFKQSLLSTAQVDTSVYTITGVAFYDKIHGQLGAAPNAIEIHPILSISKK